VEDAIIIKPGEAIDVPRLTEIYNYYIANTPISFDTEPISVEQRLSSWFNHYGLTGPYRLLVAKVNGKTVGYATSSQFRTKAAYYTSVESSIYIDPLALYQGIGSKLYAVLFEQLEDTEVHRAYVGITLPNEASMALHRKFGFKEIGVYSEVGYKFGQFYNVCWLEKSFS